MELRMAIIGALVAIGAIVAFLLIGALTLFGGARATVEQVVPGFRPDRPGPAQRAFALLGLWGPVALVALLCLLAAIQILRVALRAFGG
jgi:hypothetical protein